MKRLAIILTIPMLFTMIQCKQSPQAPKGSPISDVEIEKTISQLIEQHGSEAQLRIETGVKQTANLWRETDGSSDEFINFCQQHFFSNPEELDLLFNKLSAGYEVLFGNFMRITKDLMRPIHLDMGPITPIDMMFGGFNASAHLTEDLFTNRIAFVTTLNFPTYSLTKKTELGSNWSRKQWAYARMGDIFTSRVPAELVQNYSQISTNADAYIDEYNIHMGKLLNENNQALFPEDMKLITHWGLRDEIKSQYANGEKGIEAQEMIYQIMQRIIDQSIPEMVINNPDYTWKPISNSVQKEGKEISFSPEPNTRYLQVLNLFGAIQKIDAFNPEMPTLIQRTFEGTYEIPVEEVEQLFIDFVSSEQVRNAGKLISQRLGRPLKPYDIWYDGFKSRSSIPAEKLDNAVGKR
ncbi:MAG TPA: hypothetical protein PLV65_06855, partial [Tenuifilaceae bacterium]|nr:hypothetical protein [Tenuifilaceae bacterium]